LFFDASLVYFQAVAFSTAPTTITLPDLLTTKLPFYWRVRSLNAGGQYSLWSSVRSFHPSLPAPTLTHPDQWDVHVPPLATFSWNPVDEATSYILQVSINYDFKVLVINKTITTTSYTLSTPLGLNKEYEWRVKAVGTYPSPWSETRSIYVQ
jgi:hypothetical protein